MSVVNTIGCNVIRDLLPLYIEGMACEDSVRLVQSHIETCQGCKSVLQGMREDAKLQIRDHEESLWKLNKQIQKRKTTAMLFAFLLSVSILLSAFMYLTMPVYLPADEGVSTLIVAPDNTLCVVLGAEVEGYEIWNSPINANKDASSITILTWKTRLGQLLSCFDIGEKIPEEFDKVGETYLQDTNYQIHASISVPDSCRQIKYASHDGSTEDTYIYGANLTERSITLPRLAMSYYFYFSLAAGILFVILWMIFRKTKIRKGILGCAFFSFSFAVSEILVMGGNFMTHHMGRALISTLLSALTVWGSCMVGWKLVDQKKQDRMI